MAIDQLKFPERFSTINSDGVNNGGIVEYIENGTRYYDFLGTQAVKIDLSQDMFLDSSITKTVTLQAYANGVKEVMDYHLEESTSNLDVRFAATISYVDVNGNVLPSETYYDSEGNRQLLIGKFPYSFTLSGYGDITIGDAANKPIYFYPSAVNYGRDPVAGQDPNVVHPDGAFVFAKAYENTYPSLNGIITRDDFFEGWSGPSTPSLTAISYTADQYDNYFNWLDEHGDGTKITPDPSEKDPSEEGGGGSTDYNPGTKGPHGDDVGIPGLPTVSAVQSGFITMYNPSVANLRSLAGKLWSNDFFENIEKVMNDPFDAIICLNMIPFAPSTSGSTRILIGNYDSAVVAPIVSNQYKNISCGSVRIPENWRNFIDYENTTVDIFLPFVGFKPLNINDVMNDTLAVEYNCDILTGQATCFVTSNGYCLYQYACSIAAQIPLSGSQNSAMVTALSNMATSTISGFIAGGAVGAAGSALISGSSAAIAMQSKQVERGGSLNGAIGHLGGFTPYIVIHKPVQSLPSNYRSLKGYPSNIGGTLGSFSGYTEVSYVHLDGVDATDREKEEIDRLLKEGVIL